MRLAGSFFGFIDRVMKAVGGRLSKDDTSKLNSVLTSVGTKNYIIAKGILSALSTSGVKKPQIDRFAKILEKAHERINEQRAPFSLQDKKDLREILHQASLSEKTVSFIENLDVFALEQVKDLVSSKKTMTSDLPLPTRKTVTFEESSKKNKTPSQKKELNG